MVASDFVFLLAIAFVVGCNFYFGRRIESERLAMQWGADGRPNPNSSCSGPVPLE